MKRSILLIIMTFALLLCGCGKIEYEASEIRLVKYYDILIKDDYDETEISEIVAFFNKLDWKDGRTRTAFDYTITFSEEQIFYYSLSQRILNDKLNKRHVKLIDKEVERLNELLGIPVDEAVTE